MAAARNKKDAVLLDGVYFSSTWQAWKTTEIHRHSVQEFNEQRSASRCIAFRGRLKKRGELHDFGHHWVLVPRNGVEQRIPSEIGAPTEDPTVLELRTRQLEQHFSDALLANPPSGESRPSRLSATRSIFVRDPKVRAYVLLVANGSCECCHTPAPFYTDDGPFLEVHHLITLAEGGPDTVQNAIAICPNCHRALHISKAKNELKDQCYANVSRLRIG